MQNNKNSKIKKVKDNNSEENNSINEDNRQISKQGHIIQEFLGMSVGSHSPIQKMSDENVNKLLEVQDKHDSRVYENKKGKRNLILILSIFFGVLILLTLFIFKDNEELLKIIISSLVTLIAGAFGGYGFGLRNGRNSDE